jgi:hypothetical protein
MKVMRKTEIVEESSGNIFACEVSIGNRFINGLLKELVIKFPLTIDPSLLTCE